MKKLIENIIILFLKIAIAIRYRVTIKGLDKLNPENLKKSGGVLFLPNHPAIFIDPTLVVMSVWKKYPIRPMIVEYFYYMPGIHALMKFVDALPIPNFEKTSNTLKKRRSEKVFEEVIQDIEKGDNFLIYPSGMCKAQAQEVIAGASGAHRVISGAPNANVVLVRVKGLWGSIFSKYYTGVTPDFMKTLWQGVKYAFKNFIFFIPKRKIIIEYVPAPADFPYGASRKELNKWLENWYNQPDGLSDQEGKYPGDSLKLISYSRFSHVIPEVHRVEIVKEKEIEIKAEEISPEIKDKVFAKLSEMTGIEPSKIHEDQLITRDLGLDSLDGAELSSFLNDYFDVPNVTADQLTTVGRLLAIADRKIEIKVETVEKEIDIVNWGHHEKMKIATVPEGKTVPEVFFNNCNRMKSAPACSDLMVGTLTYSQMKLRVILLAEYIRHLPGKYIGIMLPANVGAYICTLATVVAGKVPIMINWTLGPKHLESVIEISGVKVVLSAWKFLDRLENVDLNGVDDILIMLEDLKNELSLKDKLRAAIRSKYGTKRLLKTFGIENLTEDDYTVMLFTSGTESLPKGVPLSHKNLLSNIRDVIAYIKPYQDDIFLGILPPFHAFGFNTSGMIAILSGIKIAFYPDPKDGAGVAKSIERWSVTIACGAPTFLKKLLHDAKPEQLKTLRMFVSGAEKAPPELLEMLDRFGKKDTFVEGYGVTEGSPVLTANTLETHNRGVGKPMPSIDILIVHPETYEILQTGESGLILARGPNIFSGYINPGVTPPFVTVDGKEWYKTGDYGYLDEEGFLIISGRLKRFIKSGGEMVSLPGIEDALLKASSKMGWETTEEEGPALAITAVEEPGQKSRIFLFTRFDSSKDEVNRILREAGFSNLVKISKVKKVDEIPLLGSGKIHYRSLEEQYHKELMEEFSRV